MKNELTVIEKFEYIVEDPFWSDIYLGWVRVDDNSVMFINNRFYGGCDDGLIEILYKEWKAHQQKLEEFDQSKA